MLFVVGCMCLIEIVYVLFLFVLLFLIFQCLAFAELCFVVHFVSVVAPHPIADLESDHRSY